jgi:hypothetical protein
LFAPTQIVDRSCYAGLLDRRSVRTGSSAISLRMRRVCSCRAAVSCCRISFHSGASGVVTTSAQSSLIRSSNRRFMTSSQPLRSRKIISQRALPFDTVHTVGKSLKPSALGQAQSRVAPGLRRMPVAYNVHRVAPAGSGRAQEVGVNWRVSNGLTGDGAMAFKLHLW